MLPFLRRLLCYLFIITLVATIMLLRLIPKLYNLPQANKIEFILEGYCQRPKVIPLLQQPIQFSHVGKTGGTTVTNLLIKWQEQVLPGKRWRFRYYKNFTLQSKADWNCKGIDKFDSGLFLGHLGIGYCEKLIKSGNRPFVIITLRHPIELLRSAYQYAIEHPELYPEAAYLTNKTLSEWIVEWDKNPESDASTNFRNIIRFSSRHLCGIHECHGLKDDEAFALALENLKKCDVVAVTERLNDIVDQFRFSLPMFDKLIDSNFKLPELNASKKPKDVLTKEAQKILERWAKYEVPIYEEALKMHKYFTKRARVCMALESVPD